MLFNQSQKVPWRIAPKGGFAEMRVGAQEIGVGGAEVGKVAAPAARNPDLFTRGLCMVDHQRAPTRLRGAEHTGGTRAKDECVDLHIQRGALFGRF